MPIRVAKQGEFTALLLTTELAIHNEAKKMEHCLFNTYTGRIKNGAYAAYHVRTPMDHKGYTLGFVKKKSGFWFDQIKGFKNAAVERTEGVNTLIMRVIGALNYNETPT